MAYGLDQNFRPRSSSWRSLLVMLIIVAGAIGVIIFGTTALTTGDLLWFVSGFGERPSLIVVHCAGTAATYEPGSTEFERLTASLNTDLSGHKFSPPGIGLSEGTQTDYWSKNLVVEVLYAQPVRLHGSFRYSPVDSIIYPISGAHSSDHIVFGRLRNIVLTGVNIGDEGAAASTLKGMGYTWDQFGVCNK